MQESNTITEKKGEKHDYEPYDHGNTELPLSRVGALLHITKYTIGTGVLSLPYCFMRVGYAVGLPLTLVISLVYIYIIHTLLKVEYTICKREQKANMTYVGIVESVFTPLPKLKVFAVSLMYFNYVFNGITGNSSYLLVIGDSLKSLYDGIFGADLDIQIFITVIVVPLIFICLIPKLRFLVPLSMFTNVFNALNMILIPLDPVAESENVSPAQPYVGIAFIPQFFGIAIGAYSLTGFVFPVKNDMEKPKYFGSLFGVFHSCSFIVTVCYTLFGFFGYYRYGNKTNGNILSNLSTNLVTSKCIFFMYSLAVCVSFTLQFYIVFDTIWNNFLKDKLRQSKLKSWVIFLIPPLVKISINLSSFLLALVIPNLELFSSLLNSIGIIAELCIPPVLQIVLTLTTIKEWKSSKIILDLVKQVVVVLLGLFLFINAFIGSINDIIAFYKSSEE